MVVTNQDHPAINGLKCPSLFLARPSITLLRDSVFPKAYAPAYIGFLTMCQIVL